MERSFKEELIDLLNRHSMENGSDTHDFLLASYLVGCLVNWNRVVGAREGWYGRPRPGVSPEVESEPEAAL